MTIVTLRLARLLLLVKMVAPILGGCPKSCRCSLKEGRKTVFCTEGGRTSIPISDIDANTHIIVMSPPEDDPNDLIIGRIFTRFTNLEVLRITHSNVPAIGDSTFWPGRRLKTLDLSHNNVRFLRASDFNGLKNLQELDLGYNRISATPSAPFRFLINLTRLVLKYNNLNILVPRFFYPLSNLKELDLSGNSLGVVNPEDLQDVQGLKILRLSNCHITQLHPLLYQNLPELEVIDISLNYLSILHPKEFRHLRHLRSLWIQGNAFTELYDDTFYGHSLRVLDLSNNSIVSFSQYTFRNCSIYSLDISSNKFNHLPLGLMEPLGGSTEVLNISYIPDIEIASFAEAMISLKKLKVLQAANNGFKELPEEIFKHNHQLHSLNLSHNQIEKLPSDLLNSSVSFDTVDLSFNSLATIGNEVLHILGVSQSMKELRLDSNPYYCYVCDIKPMILWLNSTTLYNSSCRDGVCLTCYYPPDMMGRLLTSVTPEELGECIAGAHALRSLEYASKTGLLVALIIIMVIVFIIVLTIYVYRRRMAHYYTNEEHKVPVRASNRSMNEAVATTSPIPGISETMAT